MESKKTESFYYIVYAGLYGLIVFFWMKALHGDGPEAPLGIYLVAIVPSVVPEIILRFASLFLKRGVRDQISEVCVDVRIFAGIGNAIFFTMAAAKGEDGFWMLLGYWGIMMLGIFLPLYPIWALLEYLENKYKTARRVREEFHTGTPAVKRLAKVIEAAYDADSICVGFNCIHYLFSEGIFWNVWVEPGKESLMRQYREVVFSKGSSSALVSKSNAFVYLIQETCFTQRYEPYDIHSCVLEYPIAKCASNEASQIMKGLYPSIKAQLLKDGYRNIHLHLRKNSVKSCDITIDF